VHAGPWRAPLGRGRRAVAATACARIFRPPARGPGPSRSRHPSKATRTRTRARRSRASRSRRGRGERKRREEEVHVASAVSARSRQGIAVLGFFVRSDLPPSRRCRSWGRPRSCRVTGPRTTPGRCRAPRAGRSRSPACPRRGRDSSSTLSRWSAIGGRVTAPEFLRGEEVQERPWRNHQRPSCWRGATMPATRDHVVEECPGRVPHAAQPFVQDVVRVEETSDSCDRGPQTAESCTRRSRPASRRPESLAVPRFVKNRRFDPGSVPVFPPPRPLIPPP